VPDLADQAAAAPRSERTRVVGLAFRRAYHSLRRLRAREAQCGDGQPGNAHYELLARLHEEGPLAAGALAERMNVKPATVSQMVDALVEAGFVERSGSDRDRRVVVIRLTRRGRPWIAARRNAWRERWTAALAEFDDGELATAAAVLDRIGELFESEEGARAADRR
jgi:DNA-binding MarR family transcriptional regulator